MYGAIAWILMVLTAPIWIPLAIYIGLKYHWTDTVPKEEDYEY